MKFLNNLDLQKNEIQNFRVQNLASAPSNPVVGQHYFNTTDSTEYVWNGTKWIDALSQGDYTFTNGIVEEGRTVSLTAATTEAIGGVIVGTNIDVNNGTISVKDATNAQKGLIQIATDEEAAAGSNETKAVNAKQVEAQIQADIEGDIELTDLSIAAGSTNYLEYNNTNGQFGAKVSTAPSANDTNLITSGAVYANEVSAVAAHSTDEDKIVITKAGTDTTITIDNVEHATKDAAGNTITTTYATKTEVADDITLTDLSIASASTNYLEYNNTTGEFGAKVDTTVTANSTNLVTSGAVKTAIDDVNDGAVVDVELKENTTDTITVTKGDGTDADIKISLVDEATALTGQTATITEINQLASSGVVTADLTKLHNVTADATELNVLDGITATTAELNILDGVTADATEINVLDDITATTNELNQLAGSGVVTADLTKLHNITATATEVSELHEAGAVKADFEKLHAITISAAEINNLPNKIELTDLSATGPITYDNTTGVISATYDNAPTDDSNNLVKSGAIKAALDDKLDITLKGAANGLAELDANGQVPADQLPSFVDDVLELVDVTDTAPATASNGDLYYNTTDHKIYTYNGSAWGNAADPETGKIYVNKQNDMSYRWSGSTLAQIGADKLKGFEGTITGDGTTTNFTITHNLGTRNVVFEIFEASSPYEKVYVQVLHTSTSAINVVFGSAPAVGEDYNVTVLAVQR